MTDPRKLAEDFIAGRMGSAHPKHEANAKRLARELLAALDREALLAEEIRVREESQIPVIPRGAAERLRATEAQVRAALDREADWKLSADLNLYRVEQAETRADALEAALREIVDAAAWYCRCLEDVQDRKVVRGLDEARSGYDSSLDRAREALAAHGKGEA